MRENSVEILLVEDNMSDAELTIRALKKKNLTNNLIHLRNGAEALDFIFARGAYATRDAQRFPKVILLDFNNFSKAVSDLGFYWLLLNEAPRYTQSKGTSE